ncbi:unnamed protein product [Aphanomyces euteiches]|uniref:Aquaporin n=1 Tax=Aphanomyces euteiches TaxID=100861 RepID=A0A6G0WRA5_9STRA|nr:hypothetical protein Ae201684_012476 [Aphanomyces euteiches]KAF0729988.1 hypothetical protein Ae201684_012477 [Aphanomyces euteiches]KAH9090413.1 hypothetical protein Ae201684P_014216 [Aphanomyces euteiches]KAH9090647.1 hypothetical protein Ae201684P_014442 [Aphanomyces euteiches]KAH9148058.1 hypothetical protein AeRB84_008447 [Aphanomyces euteiches]
MPSYKASNSNQWWRIRNRLARECLAEIAGTFIMMILINGVSAQGALGEGKKGGFTETALGCGLAVMLGLHTAGGISGAHLNPSISIAMAVYGKLPWKKVPFYIVSQFVGAFVAAYMVFLAYYPAINTLDPDRTMKTAGIFATYPASWENNGSAFVNEMIGTALLVFTIFSVDDPANMPTNAMMKPLTVGLIVVMLVQSFSLSTGATLNPARDLGPRVLSACAGWGSQVFTLYANYWWVPICGPIVGAILGGGTYMLFIFNHHDQDDGRPNNNYNAAHDDYESDMTSPVVSVCH